MTGGILSLCLIVGGTLITGAANSLLTKYQDNQCVKNCSGAEGTPVKFEQPGIQTLQMFLGELAMFLVYIAYRYHQAQQVQQQQQNKRGADASEVSILSSPESAGADDTEERIKRKVQAEHIGLLENWRLAIPAICDLSCTTLLNIGLVYTPVSIYQMTRGSVVLFVAILSVVFLKRKITKLQWLSLSFVTLGVAIVGLSGSRHSGSKSVASAATSASAAGAIILGISLIVVATSLQGIQFVVEEHILARNPIMPLQLVYIEGFFGTASILFFMILLNYIFSYWQTPDEFADSKFNMIEAFAQTVTNPRVLISSILIMISIATFNFCGLSITHRISATARSTVDTCRTLIVWIVAIAMGWEQFHWLQLSGFIVLVCGTLCFNGVIKPEEWRCTPSWLKEKTSDGQDRAVAGEEGRGLIEDFEEFEGRT
ncbi:uncharacterized protein LODBEIA_P22360 [Lodderomyces beijingensis]|uniref:Sugar phosphate transporter domain-containing protein n=1 Tax=Lodderomyces beijingensis TaxID=1775926 RepID=A0ABP0ZPC2_9ASCO